MSPEQRSSMSETDLPPEVGIENRPEVLEKRRELRALDAHIQNVLVVEANTAWEDFRSRQGASVSSTDRTLRLATDEARRRAGECSAVLEEAKVERVKLYFELLELQGYVNGHELSDDEVFDYYSIR